MTAIPLKDIPGALIEYFEICQDSWHENGGTKRCPSCHSRTNHDNSYADGRNSSITEQGKVKLTLSREKLGRFYNDYMTNHRDENDGYGLGDSIISNLKDLIMVEK